jgi:hypothetical protein
LQKEYHARFRTGQIAVKSAQAFASLDYGACGLYHNDYQYLYKNFVDQSPRPVLPEDIIPEHSF